MALQLSLPKPSAPFRSCRLQQWGLGVLQYRILLLCSLPLWRKHQPRRNTPQPKAGGPNLVGQWAAKKAETETALKMITTYKDLGDLAEEVRAAGVPGSGGGSGQSSSSSSNQQQSKDRAQRHDTGTACGIAVITASGNTEQRIIDQLQKHGRVSHATSLTLPVPPTPPIDTDAASLSSRTTTPAPLRTWRSRSPTSRSLGSRRATCRASLTACCRCGARLGGWVALGVGGPLVGWFGQGGLVVMQQWQKQRQQQQQQRRVKGLKSFLTWSPGDIRAVAEPPPPHHATPAPHFPPHPPRRARLPPWTPRTSGGRRGRRRCRRP